MKELFPPMAGISHEALLELALFATRHREDEEQLPVVEQIMANYVINQFANEGRTEFTDDEIFEAVLELKQDYDVEQAVKNGYFEVEFDEDGEIQYNVTDKGRKFINDNYGHLDPNDDSY